MQITAFRALMSTTLDPDTPNNGYDEMGYNTGDLII